MIIKQKMEKKILINRDIQINENQQEEEINLKAEEEKASIKKEDEKIYGDNKINDNAQNNTNEKNEEKKESNNITGYSLSKKENTKKNWKMKILNLREI